MIKNLFAHRYMDFRTTYGIFVDISIFVIGVIMGRLSMAIQYAVMSDISKAKKEKECKGDE